MGTLGETAESFLGPIGLSIPSGEKGRSVLELVWARPTAEFNGIIGGYTGKGFKTVIAAEASAKVSFRLVHKQDPGQDPRGLPRLRAGAACRPTVRSSSQPHGGSPAIQLSYDSPFLTKAKDALSDEWPKPAVMLGERRLDPGRRRFPEPARHGIAAGRLRASPTTASIRPTRNTTSPPSTRASAPGRASSTASLATLTGDQPMTIRFHKNDLPDLGALRCRRGGHRHRDAGPEPASRPALRGADLAGRRHRRRDPDRARPEARRRTSSACCSNRNITKLFHFGRFDLAVLYNAFGVMAGAGVLHQDRLAADPHLHRPPRAEGHLRRAARRQPVESRSNRRTGRPRR